MIDVIREVRPPFSPEAVVEEFCDSLKQYRVSKVSGDNYAGEWPKEQFRKFGVNYEKSARSKSELFLDMIPYLNSRMVDLLDHSKLVSQLVSLDRRTSGAGKDRIEKPKGGHDDVANAVAGAVMPAAKRKIEDERGGGRGGRSFPKVNLGYAEQKRRRFGDDEIKNCARRLTCRGTCHCGAPSSQRAHSCDRGLRTWLAVAAQIQTTKGPDYVGKIEAVR